MPRPIDETTLDNAALYYASIFLLPNRPHPRDAKRLIAGPDFVISEFYKFRYKDEFERILAMTRDELGKTARARFDDMASKVFTPRSDEVFEAELKKWLAIDRDGSHIEGTIGKVQVGSRIVGDRMQVIQTPKRVLKRIVNAYWPEYAGETEERSRPGGGAAGPFPDGMPGQPVGATVTKIANTVALGMCDYAVDQIDSGTGAGVLKGRTGSQPADPDTTASGTLLFTLVYSATAFGAAADAAPGGQATANSITDDSSADATGTLGYCRISSSNDGSSALDDLIDGEAGTSGADFNFNTLSIVSGATVSMTSHTITQPES